MNFQDLFDYNIKFVNLGGWLKYFIKLTTKRRLFKNLSRNKELLSKKSSDTCYICALGPSLKEVDLSKIDGDTIVVNRFYKIGCEYPEFIPTFYLMIDALFQNEENKRDFLDCLKQYRGKKTSYLINSQLAGNKELISDEDNVYYLSCFKGLFNPQRDFSIDKVMPAFGNVACTAIACAMALGYKKIVLLGCDFNSFASTTRNHCYAEKSESRLYRMSFELYCYSLVADMHDNLQKYASKNSVEIINSTKGSLIDAYKHEIIESLYK